MVRRIINRLMILMAMIFTNMSAKWISGISTQSDMMQDSGFAAGLFQTRARDATGFPLGNGNMSLKMGYDTDPLVDSDQDGLSYNDQDYFEELVVLTGDGNLSTFKDNQLIHVRYESGGTFSNVIVSAGIRPVFSDTNFFNVENDSVALMNFSVVDDYEFDRSQKIEIRTKAMSRNIR